MTGAKVVAPPFDCTTVGTDRSFVLLCTTLCQREGEGMEEKGSVCQMLNGVFSALSGVRHH